MEALNDRDRGVMRQACITAGESRNPVFTVPLANIVRTERHLWVVRAASAALTGIGGHWAATEAWIERMADEPLFHEAMQFLADKLEHPKSAGSGSSRPSREGRVALREKWQRFFANPQRQTLVQSGKPVPVTSDETHDLFGGTFHLSLTDGTRWPRE